MSRPVVTVSPDWHAEAQARVAEAGAAERRMLRAAAAASTGALADLFTAVAVVADGIAAGYALTEREAARWSDVGNAVNALAREVLGDDR